jgi:lactobin A/cerein 7B family class IIb bacteriocin
MTNFNTDYNNTELLDQELTIEQLEAVAGGILPAWVALWILAGTAAALKLVIVLKLISV